MKELAQSCPPESRSWPLSKPLSHDTNAANVATYQLMPRAGESFMETTVRLPKNSHPGPPRSGL